MEVKIKKLQNDIKLPSYATEGAGCLDCYLPTDTVIHSKVDTSTTIVPLGFSLEVPKGYTARLNLRSSIFRDYPLVSFEGIIDEDFRGEVKLYVKNLTNQRFYFKKDTRICQIDLTEKIDVVLKDTDKLTKTTRGKQSGSTGK